jgi:hypothetical protein
MVTVPPNNETARPRHRLFGKLKIGLPVRTTAGEVMPTKHRIYTTPFASVYPLYVAKAQRKGRTPADVDAILRWLTGYSPQALANQLDARVDFETFFRDAPALNPVRRLIKGVICGVRLEDIQEPTMREIRYLDKLVDELARGKPLEKILRADPAAPPVPLTPSPAPKASASPQVPASPHPKAPATARKRATRASIYRT